MDSDINLIGKKILMIIIYSNESFLQQLPAEPT